MGDELMRYVNRLRWLKTALEERLQFKMPRFEPRLKLRIGKTFNDQASQGEIMIPVKDAPTQTPFIIDEINLTEEDEDEEIIIID